MTINIGVIGAGPWGKNHIRVYSNLEDVKLHTISDLNEKWLEKAPENTKTTKDYKEILNNDEIQAVSICTPAATHYSLTKEALLAGKHVLVEKPLTTKSEQAEELVKIAEEKGLTLAVGQIFRFDPSIRKVKEEIEKGTFGKVYSLSLTRMGLKKPREDAGAIINYAVHDLDIMCDVLNKKYPKEITAITTHPLNREYEDLAIVSARFEDGTLGYCQVSWLIPKKIREFWLIGEHKSAHIDPISFDLEIFDAGIIPQYEDFGGFKLITKEGPSNKPEIDKKEPLGEEIKHFIECIKENKKPVISGEVGLRTIKMVEAALISAKEKKTIYLDEDGNPK
jgi:UDP-N-acetylglucosamine 3-dehydrogenase